MVSDRGANGRLTVADLPQRLEAKAVLVSGYALLFEPTFGDVPGMVVAGPRKEHIDLRVAMRTQLERAGIRAVHIDSAPPCTKCEPERFFSYRRDGRDGGVHMGFIALR